MDTQMINPLNVRLKPAGPSDYPFYFNLKCEADNLHWSGYAHKPDYHALERWFTDRVARQGGDSERTIYIIEEWVGSEPARLGYVYVDRMIEPQNACELAIAVSEKHAGRGIGKVALAEALRIAADLGFTRNYAYIREDNDRSKRLFGKVGFKATGRTTPRFIENLQRTLVMEEHEADVPRAASGGNLNKHSDNKSAALQSASDGQTALDRTFFKRALVIGYGSIGKRHTAVLEEMGCQVAVVSRHATLEERPCFRTVQEAVLNFHPDYAVIGSRTVEHMDTLKELEACGFKGTCMMEKPICASAEQLIAAPTFSTVVGYPLRFHPLIQAARQILEGKSLLSLHAYVGQYLPTWRPGTDYRQCYSAHSAQGGGVLRDLSHELDYLQFLGGPWQRVCASGGHRSALEIDSDDQFLMLIQLQACRDVVCHVDYLSRITRRFCSIQYEGGTLWLDFIENRLMHNEQTRQFEQTRNALLVGMHRSAFEQPDKGSCVCTWQEAVDTLNLIESAEQSVREEKWICQTRP